MNLKAFFSGILLSLLICMLGSFNLSIAAEEPEAQKGADISANYTVGPGDILEINVWREPDLSRQVLVRPDGKITFPLIDDIQASGMTTLDLKALITEQLQGFIESPEVTVIVDQSNSRNFYISGKVNAPGTYQLSPNMTILQALSVARGFAEWAHKDSVRIIRRTNGKEKIFTFNYDKVIAGKNLEQNIVLEPNDTIIVP